MHFHSSLILFFAFTFFASVQASPVRSLHVVFRSFVLIFHPQVHLELLNGRDNVYTVDVALPTENIAEPFPTEIVGFLFFFSMAIAPLIFYCPMN